MYALRIFNLALFMLTLSLQMRLAKAEKRFSQCSLLQRSLTEMQILTDGLPSVREIEEEIRYVLNLL